MTEGAFITFITHFMADQSISTARGIQSLISACLPHTSSISSISTIAQSWLNHELLTPLSTLIWDSQLISSPLLPLPPLSWLPAGILLLFGKIKRRRLEST